MSRTISRDSHYLRLNNTTGANTSESYISGVLILIVDVLYIYACWYVQTFSNISILVKSCTIGIPLLFILHIIFEAHGDLLLEMVPKGVWINLGLSIYCMFVGPFVAYDFYALFASLIIYTGYAVASVVMCYISSMRGSIDWFLKTVIATALLCAFYALTRGQRYFGYGLRLSAHNNIHIFSLVLVFGVFALAYRAKNTVTSVVIHLIPSAFLMYCIVESSSRKCFTAAAIILLLWLGSVFGSLWREGQFSTKIVVLLLAILIAYSMYRIYTGYFIHSRTFQRFETFTDEDSNAGRISMYKTAFKIFLQKPLFGGGFDQYKFWSGGGGYSHATYAEAIADFGIIGSVLYFTPLLLMGISLFKKAFSSRNSKCQLVLAFYIAEMFLGIGQIFFLESQHIFIATTLYWLEMNETRKKNEPQNSKENTNGRYRFFVQST